MKDYKAYFIIPEEPALVYQALTQQDTIELWTGEKAIMQAEPNTEFSLWDDDIVGKNLAFEPGKTFQQEWYFGEQEEPSIVTIILHPHGKGTSLELRHTNIPEDAYDDLVEGWNEVYMASLIDFYSGES
ncbi:MAG: SRPBCC domain-containing protein [Hydrotalea sp.]|nr:SRPBCC domain-containing protein [Hydrotalea sp.]